MCFIKVTQHPENGNQLESYIAVYFPFYLFIYLYLFFINFSFHLCFLNPLFAAIILYYRSVNVTHLCSAFAHHSLFFLALVDDDLTCVKILPGLGSSTFCMLYLYDV